MNPALDVFVKRIGRLEPADPNDDLHLSLPPLSAPCGACVCLILGLPSV
jgi:hypothetical protein